MRFKLLRRRLTISAPRMAIRSSMPWPLRWAGVAIVLGFCGAISLWTFEFGKSIAGLDTGAKEELVRLRDDVERLRSERDKAQSGVNTSASLITAEKAAQERLGAQIKLLQAENRSLRDDLAFFERLIPASGSEGVAIRALQAEVLGKQLKWQMLVIHPVKNAAEFHGKLEVSIAGMLDGKPWTMELPGGPQALQFRQYRRIEGMVELPAQAVVKNVSAKVVEGAATRAVQSIKL
ncbi:hypothetical protein GCM10027034_38840 [Ramlibacter solisilvae]|uniref:Uncharacterized protein n=1 Tax=Ramlibacter tataouinensis TaxID=94132 RepID=A0A127JUH2_9BURK|nr:DUF6776 family protein [Ramlibacter tataouinensis]AMO23581.1 hypothetical protein UC35_12645 [Ramlibacter tataouinensis]